MLAYLVMMYDVKLPDSATRPSTLCFEMAMIADPNAEVMFRKRVD